MGELQDRIAYLESQINETKEKKFKLPWRAKIGNRKAQKGWVGVIKINENGVITPSKQQIQNQCIMIDDVPRLATGEHVLKWKIGMKTYPVIIQPSWSVEPLTVKSMFKESTENGTNKVGLRILLEGMKSNLLENKKKGIPLWVWIIGGLIIAGAVYALATGKL